MKHALIAFLVVGFFFGFAGTKYKPPVQLPVKKLEASTLPQAPENFDFLYGKWEVIKSYKLKARAPTSLNNRNLSFLFEDNLYLDSNASRANAKCPSGVEFSQFSKGESHAFIKRAKALPLLSPFFSSGRREGIWSGQVVCRKTRQPIWNAMMISRRQLFLVSKTDVVELYRRESARPIRENFTDSDEEVASQ